MNVGRFSPAWANQSFNSHPTPHQTPANDATTAPQPEGLSSESVAGQSSPLPQTSAPPRTSVPALILALSPTPETSWPATLESSWTSELLSTSVPASPFELSSTSQLPSALQLSSTLQLLSTTKLSLTSTLTSTTEHARTTTAVPSPAGGPSETIPTLRASSEAEAAPSDRGGSNAKIIAAIVVPVVIGFVLLIAAAIFFLLRRRRKKTGIDVNKEVFDVDMSQRSMDMAPVSGGYDNPIATQNYQFTPTTPSTERNRNAEAESESRTRLVKPPSPQQPQPPGGAPPVVVDPPQFTVTEPQPPLGQQTPLTEENLAVLHQSREGRERDRPRSPFADPQDDATNSSISSVSDLEQPLGGGDGRDIDEISAVSSLDEEHGGGRGGYRSASR